MSGAPVRPPAVAGLFYPARPEEIEAALRELLVPVAAPVTARAVIVPHAAWMYSGAVAGAVYGRVAVPRRVIVLGPNHTGLGAAGAVMARGAWALPGDAVPIDEPLATALLAASPLLVEDRLAHRREHAIEVQLPFLRRRTPGLGFVPVTLGRIDLDFCAAVGRAVAAAVRAAGEPVLIVCSTDLNHYEADAVARRKDRLAIDAMLAVDPARLAAVVDEHRISMCGLAPALATLVALRELGPGPTELVRYATSGEVSGDYASVVGYAGLILR